MSNERHDPEQLTLDFDAKERALRENRGFSGLSLVINNTANPKLAATTLEPNSPEITRIIRNLGKALGW